MIERCDLCGENYAYDEGLCEPCIEMQFDNYMESRIS
jgi:hypothetical protein